MKSIEELNRLKDFIESSYNRFGNLVLLDQSRKFNPRGGGEGLAYCFKFTDTNSGNIIYSVTQEMTGNEELDLRILAHEYGHIYQGHLDGIHEVMDSKVCNVIRDYRVELEEKINRECGIDFAEKLLDKVIDDPRMNHMIHNIAMDMEVNSVVLDSEDIDIIEAGLSKLIVTQEEEILGYIADNLEEGSEDKKKAEETLKRMKNSLKIKFIKPERYSLSDGSPFPSKLSYPEYLVLIINNLDQFIKMAVSLSKGGDGDPNQVTADDVRDALGSGSNSSEGEGSSSSSGGNPSDSLDDILDQLESSNGSGGKDGAEDSNKPGKGKGGKGKDGKEGDKDSSAGDKEGEKYGSETYQGCRDKKDHGTEARKEADKKRELGEIKSNGGVGCDNSGAGAIRDVTLPGDEVDQALDEVVRNYRKRVIKHCTKRDHLYTYNRGINRTVIAPVNRRRVNVSVDPTIVYLIDISGSMDTELVDRCLLTIANKMRKINRGLYYNIISWNTQLGEHIKDVDPRKSIPKIHVNGGTRLAKGIEFFKENYTTEATLVIISDFEDYLDEWRSIEKDMNSYDMYGFNYGRKKIDPSSFRNLKVRNF